MRRVRARIFVGLGIVLAVLWGLRLENSLPSASNFDARLDFSNTLFSQDGRRTQECRQPATGVVREETSTSPGVSPAGSRDEAGSPGASLQESTQSRADRCVRLTQSQIPEERLAGVRGLCWLETGASASGEFIAILLDRFENDPSPMVRRSIQVAILCWESEAAFSALLNSLFTERDQGVLEHAILALRRLKDDAMLNNRMLESRESGIRLNRARRNDAIAELTRFLGTSQSREIRTTAEETWRTLKAAAENAGR